MALRDHDRTLQDVRIGHDIYDPAVQPESFSLMLAEHGAEPVVPSNAMVARWACFTFIVTLLIMGLIYELT